MQGIREEAAAIDLAQKALLAKCFPKNIWYNGVSTRTKIDAKKFLFYFNTSIENPFTAHDECHPGRAHHTTPASRRTTAASSRAREEQAADHALPNIATTAIHAER